ncbi:MAG: DUF1761 domain-containing protein [Streptococcaceae bacterium]|nr:DUF1761 domain-containing protein [Streptococcaceae bacterium]MCL2681027.1 DUF1761 domain-containing protein [Streptococcaceae bacterium]MCL2858364.1 DUF1761 domain-containing protein [Streptococcaceae bacterium]
MVFNILGTILGMLTFAIAGTLLYNPMHKWGQLWSEWSGMGEKMKDNKMSSADMIFTFGGTFIAGALLSTGMNEVTHLSVLATSKAWMSSSLFTAFVVWLAFFGVATFVNTVYNGSSKKLVGLHLINSLIELLLVGLVLGLFPIK